MANLLLFPYDGRKTLSLNVENVYRVDNDGSNTDEMRLFNNCASAAGTNVWVTTVKFDAAISETQQKIVEQAVRDVNQTPQGVIDMYTRDETLALDADAPFVIASESQP